MTRVRLVMIAIARLAVLGSRGGGLSGSSSGPGRFCSVSYAPEVYVGGGVVCYDRLGLMFYLFSDPPCKAFFQRVVLSDIQGTLGIFWLG